MSRTTRVDGAAAMRVIDVAGLDALIAALAETHEVQGPVKRDAAVVFEPISGTGDLPRGWIDEQSGGKYRLKREGEAWFGYTSAPATWKSLLHPPVQHLWHSRMKDGEVTVAPEPLPDRPMAFLGVRACDLAAIAVQDKVFMEGPYRDPYYAARREALFLVAVNCGRAAETCFCTSMETGPRAREGFDIALTEIGGDRFTAEAGSAAGAALLARLPGTEAGAAEREASTAASDRAAGQITKRLEIEGLRELLRDNPEHARWDEVGERCLGCGNCTMVCPTCFCTEMVEQSAIDMSTTQRSSQWASCFGVEFSYVHGGAVRSDTRARYRQWMTHKLSSWVDQFDVTGCIGCGRCITWCPVGIDITEEAAAIRASPGGGAGGVDDG